MSDHWLMILGSAGLALAITRGRLFGFWQRMGARLETEPERRYVGGLLQQPRDGFYRWPMPVRLAGHLMQCAMCMGFWVGLALCSHLGAGTAILAGAASSFLAAVASAMIVD
jgi:hypothetical protein